jgi:hypothetical protein
MNRRIVSWSIVVSITCATPVLADTLRRSSPPPMTANPAVRFLTVNCPPQIRVNSQNLPAGWDPAPTMLSLSHGYILDSRPNLLYCYYKENVLITKTVKPGLCKVAANHRSFTCAQ